jgi:hypothetical protein
MKAYYIIFAILLSFIAGCTMQGPKDANGAGVYGGISGGLSIS